MKLYLSSPDPLSKPVQKAYGGARLVLRNESTGDQVRLAIEFVADVMWPSGTVRRRSSSRPASAARRVAILIGNGLVARVGSHGGSNTGGFGSRNYASFP